MNKVLTYIFLSKEQSGIHLVQERERAERRLHNLGTRVRRIFGHLGAHVSAALLSP